MLIVLDHNSKLRDNHDIDAIISVEIPDEIKDPRLYQTIISCMMHGLCGIHNPKSVCRENGVCSKGYPKKFNSETKLSVNGYPEYRQHEAWYCNGQQVCTYYMILHTLF